jgi:ubiquinone/menaquinone biosynthesis C-methylase UbiE
VESSKIIPAVDVFVNQIHKKKITVLDIGGGTGAIFKSVSTYIKTNYRIEVTNLP